MGNLCDIWVSRPAAGARSVTRNSPRHTNPESVPSLCDLAAVVTVMAREGLLIRLDDEDDVGGVPGVVGAGTEQERGN